MKRRDWLISCLVAGVTLESPFVFGKERSGDDTLSISGINPERGFYSQVASERETNFDRIRKSGLSLVLLTLDLTAQRERRLQKEDLQALDEALLRIRAAGLKVIFRAAYGFTNKDYRVEPKDLGLVRSHIRSISEVLTAHLPVLWVVQAGMLGPWGEWHGSVYGNPPSLAARAAVVETWLDALPESVFVQVRRPRFVRDLFPEADHPLLSRVGWHNDAMLALPSDMGTYNEKGWDRERELQWSYQHGKQAPFGGETVPLSEATHAYQVERELALLRISYLNRNYHKATLEGWKTMELDGEKLYHRIERSLGYHWLVETLDRSDEGHVSLELRNVGFAPIYSDRQIEAAWLDPITLQPCSERINTGINLCGHCPETGPLKAQFKLPKNSEGNALGLLIPDAHPSLEEDGRYSLRLMGPLTEFEEDSGWNVIRQAINPKA